MQKFMVLVFTAFILNTGQLDMTTASGGSPILQDWNYTANPKVKPYKGNAGSVVSCKNNCVPNTVNVKVKK